jgi:Tfp pilus assembly protein PilX
MLKPIGGGRLQRGMSLVEIIMIIVLIGIVSLPLTKLAKTNLRSSATYLTTTMGQYDAQSIIERINGDYIANGYAATVTTWTNRTGTTNTGFSYGVSIGAEQILNGIRVRTVTVTVSGKGIPNLNLSTWLCN